MEDFTINSLRIADFYVIASNQKYIIISNGMLSNPELERLENQYKIKVKKLLHCEVITTISDLKELI